MSNLHPKAIDGYHIEGIWAEGGLCTLYLAMNPITHDHVLIKTLSTAHQHNADAEARLINEARVLSLCNHPHIAKMYAHGMWKDGPYIVLEFIRGASLRKVLRHNPIPIKRALELFIEICYAVSHLHSLGFVHRDLKPENILITDQGQIKLIDFGLACSCAEKAEKEDFSSFFAYEGTPVYMSPEAMKESALSTIERDIFSLGIIAYEMILGRISYGKVILSLLPKSLQPIIAKALQPYPDNRYHSVHECIQAILPYMESEELIKEKHGSDYFFELFEQAEKAQKTLHSSLSPREAKSGSIALSGGIEQYSLYAASLQEKEEVGFFAVEFAQKGIEGLIASFMCHYLLQMLRKEPRTSLHELWQQLHMKLVKERSIRCSYLTVGKEGRLTYWLEEWGDLFLIRSLDSSRTLQALPRGYASFLQKLSPEDTLVFVGYELPTPSPVETTAFIPLSDVIQSIILETASIPPSKQSPNVLQRLRMKGDWMHKDHPLCVIALNGSQEQTTR